MILRMKDPPKTIFTGYTNEYVRRIVSALVSSTIHGIHRQEMTPDRAFNRACWNVNIYQDDPRHVWFRREALRLLDQLGIRIKYDPRHKPHEGDDKFSYSIR